MSLYSFIKPILFQLPAETAHSLALSAMPFYPFHTDLTLYQSLRQQLFGIDFPTPLGMAAGFDKNAEVMNCLLKQGFGFVEVGTVTLNPQIGNPKPRLFRLIEDLGIINYMGLNNRGVESILDNIKHSERNGIVGVNIGVNKNTQNLIEDYCLMLKFVANYASYITINVSCPNTENIPVLQSGKELLPLLKALCKQRKSLNRKNIPMLVKFSPDLSDVQIEDLAGICLEQQIDGIIIGNTSTQNKEFLKSKYANKIGGVSGKPIFDLSTNVLGKFYKVTKGKLPLIGVGGIFSGQDMLTKIMNGASLCQLYTGYIYKGPNIIREIYDDLQEKLDSLGVKNIKEIVGSNIKT